MRGHSRKNDIPCTEHLGDPLHVGEVDLYGRIHGGLILRPHTRLAQVRIQRLARQTLCLRQARLVIHQDHTPHLRCPLARNRIWACREDMGTKAVHDRTIVALVKDARDMEHAILEDLDRNLLMLQCPITRVQTD